MYLYLHRNAIATATCTDTQDIEYACILPPHMLISAYCGGKVGSNVWKFQIHTGRDRTEVLGVFTLASMSDYVNFIRSYELRVYLTQRTDEFIVRGRCGEYVRDR